MSGFSKEENLILAFLREEITGEGVDAEAFAGIDYELLLEEAKHQAVLLLVADHLARHGNAIPEEAADQVRRIRETAEQVAAENIRVTSWQDALGRVLQDRKYVILKGLAAAAYYPRPELRSLGDVDFLIPGNERSADEEILKTAGYKPWDTDHVCHVVFKKAGAHLEMHFEIAGIPYGMPGEKTRERMKDAALRGSWVEAAGAGFPAPSPEDHAVVLLFHMQHHLLGEGLGLRHLMDWACFLDRTAEAPWWTEVIAFFREVGIERFFRVMNRISVNYFGSREPVRSGPEEETLADEVMEDVLLSGNFGAKDAVRSKSGWLISEHGKNGTKDSAVKNAWKVLIHSTESHYPVVKKHGAAYALFVPIRAVQLTGRIIREKTFGKGVIREAKERKALYSKLKVFEPEE